jgi:hypothetical protein
MKKWLEHLRSFYQSSDENRLQVVTVAGFIVVPVVSMVVLLAVLISFS